MEDRERVQSALDAIDPVMLNYEDWLHVGMALKDEGLPCAVWDSWSMKDRDRYKPGNCLRKWNSFNGDGWTIATVFHLAEERGWTSYKRYTWDDYLPAYAENYDEVIATGAKEEEQPWQMAVRYLETLFTPDESVSYVHSATYKPERDKWVPADAGHVRKVSALIRDLKRYKNLDEAFGSINENAGAWIRHNPATGAGDKDITRYGYVLVESDDLPIEDQKKLMISLKLPIAAMIESGGKSVHAIVKIQAQDKAEYRQRVEFLFDYLSKHKFIVDENNKNPARLSRLPGAERKGKIQRLIAVNIGCESWKDWKDYIEGIDDDLPSLDNLWSMFEAPDETPDEVISSILYEGGKLMITGDSKSGKTCLSQNLAVCIASGHPWLGKYQCKQGKVLYINLEIRKEMLKNRFKALFRELGIEVNEENVGNIRPWNLRGKALPLNDLAPKVIRRARAEGPFVAIVLDPVYKVQQGDENSAEAISKFCNALDKIAEETGAAIIYDHHHPKGDAGGKKAIDRGAGSGVFARDADALVDISNLDPGNDAADLVTELMNGGEKPIELSFVLRDFKDQPSQKIWFKYPIHYIDSANLLEGCYVEGSKEANLSKNPNRKSDDEKRAIVEYAFGVCQEQGFAKLSDMANYSPVKIDALRKYVNEHGGFQLNHGIVSKNDIGENTDNKNM